jgi:hypothetical protein
MSLPEVLGAVTQGGGSPGASSGARRKARRVGASERPEPQSKPIEALVSRPLSTTAAAGRESQATTLRSWPSNRGDRGAAWGPHSRQTLLARVALWTAPPLSSCRQRYDPPPDRAQRPEWSAGALRRPLTADLPRCRPHGPPSPRSSLLDAIWTRRCIQGGRRPAHL